MKPHVKLAETTTPDGATMALYEHDDSYCIRLNGQEVMNSTAMASEQLLGELACGARSVEKNASVLIGGLGLGFTLASVLEKAGPHARIHVVELIPQVIEWNRTFLNDLNGKLLKDRRITVVESDVVKVIRESKPAVYDGIALDIDNGPTAFVHKMNARLYGAKGLKSIIDALKPGGRVCFWSAREDPAFAIRLNKAGFRVQVVAAKLHENAKRPIYTIYVADL